MAMRMIEQEIRRHEEQLADAKRALDVQVIDHLYADDLLLTGVMGEPTCSKTAVIDEIKRGIAERASGAASGQPVEMSTANEDMKVVAHGDTAIANYRFVVHIKGPTMDVRRRYRTTNVWMKRGGTWQIVAAQMALVIDATQLALLSRDAR